MREGITISPQPTDNPVEDYALLRREGIQYFQKLSASQWTDHNTHDPGITIWEQLCYALTDLGYRLNFDLKDFLAYNQENPFQDLFTAAEILPGAALSLNDYRKLTIDIAGVRNAWIEAAPSETPLYYDANTQELITQSSEPGLGSSLEKVALRGLFRVLIDGEGSGIVQQVRERLHAHRSLGMDFSAIEVLQKEKISLFADISINSVEDSVALLGEVYFQLYDYIAPQIPFYTLNELMAEGKSIEEIFEGPLLEHGFIKEEDLIRFQRFAELRSSDIIQRIMDIPGVAVVRTIALGAAKEKWVLPLNTSATPQFDPLSSQIRFFRGGVEIKVDRAKAEAYAIKKRLAQGIRARVEGGYTLTHRPGKKRPIAEYRSIQYQFPENYGIGDQGLSPSESPARKAQAKQLKAYLLFFEQILANFMAQTANSARLFSFSETENRSYFAQSLIGKVPRLQSLLQQPGQYNQTLRSLTETEEEALQRKKRFLNHVLARFAEEFTEYSLVLYGALTETQAQTEEKELLAQEVEARKRFLRDYPSLSARRHVGMNYLKQKAWDSEEVSGLKLRLARLLGLEQASRSAIAYLSKLFQLVPIEQGGLTRYAWRLNDSDGNILMRSVGNFASQALARLAIHRFIAAAPIAKRYKITPSGQLRVQDADAKNIARRDGLPNAATANQIQIQLIQYFSETYLPSSPENFHVLEHILFRPILGLQPSGYIQTLLSEVPRKDPYSLQVSFALPTWAGRFRDQGFRQFVTQVIRRETPAHLSVFIHWMDWEQMSAFEEAYRSWLEALTENEN